jgi:poly(A) polymerase/tRNA nucleotidyltransferase (CCA-adding enzyme)
MREGGLLDVLLPELTRGLGVEQNEWHAYDVYHHILATVDAAPSDDLMLRLAALFHDIAKPQTKDGPHFYRHEVVGEALTREILARLRFSGETIETVTTLVRRHMFAADPDAKDATIRRFIRRVGPENLERLFALRAADVAGSGLPKRDDSNERYLARVLAVAAARPPLSVRDLALSGTDVVAELVAAGELPAGSSGGPAVGRILAQLLERVVEDPTLNAPPKLLEVARELILQDTDVRRVPRP